MQTRDIPLPHGTIREQLMSLSDTDLSAVVQQSNNWSQYVQSKSMMDGIAMDMKEIPILPSEIAPSDDINTLRKVEFPEEGGVFTWMENFEFPYRGYPYYEFVDKIDVVKKITRSFASGFYHAVKGKNILWFLLLIPSAWIAKAIVRAGVYVLFRIVERFRIKTSKYCRFVRELHRAFSVNESEFAGQLRDLACMVLEMDNAYRYRAQDILVEMDKIALVKNPNKELIRLLKLMSEREKQQTIRDTWTLGEYAIRFYFALDKEIRDIVVRTLLELDLPKTMLTNEDKQFCIPRKDYTFGFVLNPSKKDSVMIAMSSLMDGWKTRRRAIQDESTKAHAGVTDAEQIKALNEKYTKLLDDEDATYKIERAKLYESLMNYERI